MHSSRHTAKSITHTPDGLDDAIHASEALHNDHNGRIGRLKHSTDGDDTDLVLLSLAPEISAGYGKIFAYLNDNLNQAFLTVDLATRVLRTERTQRLGLQARLMSGSPLIKNRLLLLNPPDGADTHTSRRVHPSGRFLRWLLEGEELPTGLGFTPLDVSGAPLIAGDTENRIDELAPSLNKAITITVVGATSGAREGVAISIARKAERPLVRIDLERCKNYLEQPWELIRIARWCFAIRH